MVKKWAFAAIVIHLAAAGLWAQPAGGRSTGRKAKTTTAPAKVDLKYIPATPEQIAANHAMAKGWADAAGKTVTKSMHLVETKHFLIYSAWNRRDDRALAKICEKMYAAMCKQFNVPANQNIWAGKCPIFIFWKASDYVKFTTTVDKVGMVDAGGYNRRFGNGFTYIVMNHVKPPRASVAWAKTRFYEVLVHEASHAFLGRYLTHRTIPRWLNEGLAEYMAASLVPTCGAAFKHKQAAREAIAKGIGVSSIFKTVRLESFDYGIAHSLVRYLIGESIPKGRKYKTARKKSRKAFIKLITLIKKGAKETDALKQAYDVTHEQLLTSWRKIQAAKYRSRR